MIYLCRADAAKNEKNRYILFDLPELSNCVLQDIGTSQSLWLSLIVVIRWSCIVRVIYTNFFSSNRKRELTLCIWLLLSRVKSIFRAFHMRILSLRFPAFLLSGENTVANMYKAFSFRLSIWSLLVLQSGRCKSIKQYLNLPISKVWFGYTIFVCTYCA